MDRDRWKAINEIFHAALELPPSERSTFLKTATQGDPELQSDIERLLLADDHAGSYLEIPLLSLQSGQKSELHNPVLNSGDILNRLFRIVAHVGEGGMGQVFEAEDLELHVPVALKVIRPEIAMDSRSLEFFRREVRTARTITHPNVCRTYDLDHGSVENGRTDLFFITMEFLRGESLASRLNRLGKFRPEQAFSIACQIASALDAAHTAGIIHGDIKPANIMLVPDTNAPEGAPRAVITDFGLARRDRLHMAHTRFSFGYGPQAGTLAYMAPEQLEPDRPLSSAADTYAFGLVLYEMVTGQQAFDSANLLTGIAQRVSGSPPSARSVVSDLSKTWDMAINNCLARDPAERPASAGAVVDYLSGKRGSLHTNLKWRFFGPSVKASNARRFVRLAMPLGVMVTAVALLFGGMRLYLTERESAVAPGGLVLLTPLKNETGEHPLDNLDELLKASLSQSARINLIDANRVNNILEQMSQSPDKADDPSTAREVAMRAGAVRVIFASLLRNGQVYRLDIEIEQPDSSPSNYRDKWTHSVRWTEPSSISQSPTISPNLLSSVRKASDWIRDTVGESAHDLARLDVPPQDVTTSNWRALEDFTHARLLLRENRLDDAAVLLKHSVGSDPQFALGFASLGDVLRGLHRDVEAFQAYDKALELGLHDRLTRREEDRIRGMRAVDTADLELAVDAFHDLAVNYPNDPSAWTYPTVPLRLLDRDDEAIANLKRAISLDPDGAYAPYALAQELMIKGRLDEVPAWIDYLKKHNHADSAAEDQAILLFLDHQYDQAADLFRSRESASASPTMRSYSFQNLATVYADTGRDQEAIQVLNAGIADDMAHHAIEEEASKLLGRAYVECTLGTFELCLRDENAGYTLDPSPEHAFTANAILGLASSAASARFRARIRHELEGVEESLPPTQLGTISQLLKLRTRGELELADGRPKAALHTFQALAAKDAPAGDREYLARAFVAVAATEKESPAAMGLVRQAEKAYAAIALHPALVQCDAMNFPPGFYRNQLSSYLSLAEVTHDSSSPSIRAQVELKHLLSKSSNQTRTDIHKR